MKTLIGKIRARSILCILLLASLAPSFLESAAYTVRNTGNWNGTTTWRRNGTNTTIPPTINDDVTIGGARTVTITADAVCLSLTFANDANNSILTMNNGTTLTVNGAVIFNSPTGVNHNKTWNINAATAHVNGDITLNEGTDDTEITGINITSGTLDVNGSIIFNNVTSDTRTAISITGAANVTIAGNFGSSGTFGTFAPGTSTVTFDSTNDQTINLVGAMFFYNVIVNKPSGTATFAILAGPYFEAEDATLSGAVFANNHPGYSGTGFADYINPTGDYVQWTVDSIETATTTELVFRYALDTTDRPMELRVNGTVVDPSMLFTRVGPEWTNYALAKSIPVPLNAGTNTVRLTAIGFSGPNVDYLAVTARKSKIYGNFTVTSGTATIANSIIISGNLTIHGTLDLKTYSMNGNSTGKILTLGPTGILSLGGSSGGPNGSNFPIGYTGTPGISTTSRVLYCGTAAQTIATNITYGILEVSNSSGVNLANGSVTASTLSMTAGTMTTGTNVVNVSSTRNGNGLVNGSVRHVHAFTTGTPYYFEGPNTFLNFSSLTGSPTDITITSYPGTSIPYGNSATAIKRYYTITTNGGSGLAATLQLHYDATTELNGLDTSQINFTLWKYNTAKSVWEDQGRSSPAPDGTANSFVRQSGMTWTSGPSTWTITSNFSPLPVQLVSFTATAQKFDITLEWNTISEKNNYGFDIERISAGGIWEKIGFVGGNGTTTVPRTYSYTDRNTPSGQLSYRLKQIDFDGAFEYSYIVQVVSGAAPKSFSLGQNYPSPFNPSTTIEFTIPEDATTSLKVFNVLGQEVASLIDGQTLRTGIIHRAVFDGGRLSSGTYIYVLKSGKYSAVRKMVLLK